MRRTRRVLSIRLLLVASALLLVAVASSGQFSILTSWETSEPDGPVGNYPRYEGVPDLLDRGSGSGPGWIGPALAAVAFMALGAVGLTWLRRHRPQAEADGVVVAPGDSVGTVKPGDENLARGEAPCVDVAGSVGQAWGRVEHALHDRGLTLPTSRTAWSTGVAAVGIGAPPATVDQLVELYDRDRYSQRPSDKSDEVRAADLADQISEALTGRQPAR
ncbi:MAG: DUF4129 domain-containing protein [Phycicoccus sp.]